ncbi:NAD-dependent epimerase/dehydratase family protein [Streptosporangium sp. NPDC000396]|uniref:NAD-dependent epimerase/dehydratase family protein n=1 Tax=Streptosporangium sp. NPDC000396 TaxID=3366185 RepID=UPI0036C81D63
MKDVCIIGGSRYFGKRLIVLLRDAGIDVTVVNRGSSSPPPGITHLIADRDDEEGFERALADRAFDVVIDQVCYTPLQAAAAQRLFRDRTRRYVMTSTIEVYGPAGSDGIPPASPGTPVTEEAVDPKLWPVRTDLPWRDPRFLERHYGEGKRQAEAVLAQGAVFPFAAVRCAHVLGGGADDFTGRLDHYVQRILTGGEIVVHRESRPSTFIHEREIADFLFWAAGSDFVGAVNACSHGELDVTDICAQIAAHGTAQPIYRTVDSGGGEDAEVSPFSFEHYYGMDNTLAGRLGFTFSNTMDWFPGVVAEAVAVRGGAGR